MQEKTYPGKFIVLEGLDGSGQSTQAKLLKEWIEKRGQQVVLTKEPTLASDAGKKIRRILDKKEVVVPSALQELFVQDRAEHLERLIVPALKSGKIVISDRYFFSTFAYGSIDLDLDWLIKLNNKFLLPDVTFFLNTTPRVCIERIAKRDGDKRTFFETLPKLEKVWKTYKTFPKRFKNVYEINGEQSVEEVFKDLKKIITKIL